jgi:CRISPR-associated protein Cas5d
VIEEERQQCAGLFLRDVAYRVHAELEFFPHADLQSNRKKYAEIFARRAAKGQCINQPYLGCREFAADFRLVQDLALEPAPINESRDLGLVLHDMDFSDSRDPQARFFRAELKAGVVDVPRWNCMENDA